MAVTTIANLNTLVTANAVQFRQELGRASNVAANFSSGVKKALGALGVGLSATAFVAFGKSIVDLGGHITDLAAEADMPAKTFQVISGLAMDAGLAMEDTAKAAENLRSALQKASENGADPLNEKLRKLHLTADGLKALNQGEQWQVIGQRVAEAANKQEAYNTVSELFGAKLGPKLRTTLDELAKGFDNASEKTKGLVITDENLKALDAFGDRLGQVWLSVKVGAANSAKGWDDLFSLIDRKGKELSKSSFARFFVPQSQLTFVDELSHDKSADLSRGPNFLPGGPGKRGSYITDKAALSAKMRAGEAAAAANDPFKRLLAENQTRANIEKGLHDVFDVIDEQSARLQSRWKKPDLGVDLAPTDAFSRIGLVTGQATNPELKKQTDVLHKILETLNASVRRNASGTFAN